MYIPAYYYMQSKTVGTGIEDETIMIAEQFLSHSIFVDVIMNALENHDHIVEDDDNDDAANGGFNTFLASMGFHNKVNTDL